MTYNIEQINDLIRNRRSVFPKDYSGERVPDAIIEQMLENANWAPTHKLTEPWRFIVYTGDGLRTLGEQQAAVYRQVTEADGTFKQERYDNLLTKSMQSSHIIVVAMKRDEKKSVPLVEELGAVYCAIENMYLTATAYGVGAYLSTGGVTYFERAREVFGLGPEDQLVGFFHVGALKHENTLNGRRRPVSDKITWVKK